MIAHRFKITNPQDYGLYEIVNGIGKLKTLNSVLSNLHDIQSYFYLLQVGLLF